MITLTTPPQINSVLGGSVPISYNKLVVGPFNLSPVDQTITGSLRLTSTASPTMQPIVGTLSINVPASTLKIEVVQLDFYRQITLNSGQNTAVLDIISNAQNAIEAGLINLAVIAGTQSTGA